MGYFMSTHKIFKAVRQSKGLSATKLARDSGVAVATITRFEAGQKDIGLKVLEKALQSIGCDLSDLVDKKNIKKEIYISQQNNVIKSGFTHTVLNTDDDESLIYFYDSKLLYTVCKDNEVSSGYQHLLKNGIIKSAEDIQSDDTVLGFIIDKIKYEIG